MRRTTAERRQPFIICLAGVLIATILWGRGGDVAAVPLPPRLASLLIPAATGSPQPDLGANPARPMAAPNPRDAANGEGRWQASLERFAQIDRAHPPAAGGVIFLGSSSIGRWNVERAFHRPDVVNRGVDGSRMADCARLVAALVLPHRPRLVVVYAGDNDLAEGVSAQEVLKEYIELSHRIHQSLPDTRVAFLSIKPSPLRESLMPAARRANEMIKNYSNTEPNLEYIDVFDEMLDVDGRPRADLYLSDRLHLSAAGYEIWKSALAARLH